MIITGVGTSDNKIVTKRTKLTGSKNLLEPSKPSGYTEVSDCKMQEGSLRADVNLSLRPLVQATPGVRTEISHKLFQSRPRAAGRRQASGRIAGLRTGFIKTRRWDDHKGESLPMRDKEEVMDYRCFPEPDLPPVYVDEDFINEIQASIPELPGMRRERYINQYGIPKYDAGLITQNKVLADIFEKASEVCGNPKLVSNWIMTEIMKRMNEEGEGILHSYLNGDNFGQILLFLDKGDITHAAAIQVIDVLLETGEEPIVIVERLNLRVQRDESLVANTIKQVVNSNPQALDDYISGKKKAFGFFMGKIMAELKGRGDPSQVKEILTKELQRYL